MNSTVIYSWVNICKDKDLVGWLMRVSDWNFCDIWIEICVPEPGILYKSSAQSPLYVHCVSLQYWHPIGGKRLPTRVHTSSPSCLQKTLDGGVTCWRGMTKSLGGITRFPPNLDVQLPQRKQPHHSDLFKCLTCITCIQTWLSLSRNTRVFVSPPDPDIILTCCNISWMWGRSLTEKWTKTPSLIHGETRSRS